MKRLKLIKSVFTLTLFKGLLTASVDYKSIKGEQKTKARLFSPLFEFKKAYTDTDFQEDMLVVFGIIAVFILYKISTL